MKVLVCGGRDWTDYETLSSTLDELHEKLKFTLLIHGGALGADYLADIWAKNRMIPTKAYPADWKKFGTRAGPIRNKQMLVEGRPDVCVAFPGGRGTADMKKKCLKNGTEVYEVGESLS